jgi:uncharacterized protein YlaN (UPF0358 family)
MICCFFLQLGLKVDNAAIPACCVLSYVLDYQLFAILKALQEFQIN